MSFGDTGSYVAAIAKAGGSELFITRDLVFGAKGIVNFPPESYPQIKRAFDEMYGHDTHTIALAASGAGQ